MSAEQYLLLIRHGETVGNLTQIAHGQTESPLNERGIEQAQHTARHLSSWSHEYHHVYASPLSRALNTAHHVAQALSLSVNTHEHLVEGHLGILEGVTYEELDSFGYAKRSIEDDDFAGHQGESPRQVADRMEKAITSLMANHAGQNVIVVSHGGAIAQFIARHVSRGPAFGPKYIMHNAAFSEMRFSAKGPELVTLNHYNHLPEHLRADPKRRDHNVPER